ncbi:NACHT domain-containing protein [Vibrio gigantis]
MIETAVTIATKVALTELTKKLTGRLLTANWRKGTETGKEILHQLEAEHIRKRYIDNYASKVLKMRTLFSENVDVYLESIYTPLVIKSASTGDLIKVTDDVVIRTNRIINVVGIAGQGKSTILRKLFFEELKKGERLPFFIELRKVENGDILDHLKELLGSLGFSIADGYVEYLLQSHKVIMMLDGFDEVHSSLRMRTLANINSLKVRYDCQVIVTSRPNTEVCSDVGINNLHVQSLELDDIIHIIEKVNDDAVRELPAVVRADESLSKTLVTPMLVNLLCACYPHLDIIPNNVKDFYASLFNTMYIKHDKLKQFTREKNSGLTQQQSALVFNTLCFDTMLKGIHDFTDDTLLTNIERSLSISKLNEEDPSAVQEDIVNITCLIQKDGFDYYAFLHKSIQEFHAALFVNRIRANKKQEFYDLVSNLVLTTDRFDNVVNFLYQLDDNEFHTSVTLAVFKKYGIDNVHNIKDEDLDSMLDSIMKHQSLSIIETTGDLNILNMGADGELLDRNDPAYIHRYEMDMRTALESSKFLTGLGFFATLKRTLIQNFSLSVYSHTDPNYGLEDFERPLSEIASRSSAEEDVHNKISHMVSYRKYLDNLKVRPQLRDYLREHLMDLHLKHYVSLSEHYDESDSIYNFEFGL